jgi:hypothetical protein
LVLKPALKIRFHAIVFLIVSGLVQLKHLSVAILQLCKFGSGLAQVNLCFFQILSGLQEGFVRRTAIGGKS